MLVTIIALMMASARRIKLDSSSVLVKKTSLGNDARLDSSQERKKLLLLPPELEELSSY